MKTALKIGLINEGKVPPDYRVALTPNDCIKLRNLLPEVEVFVQSSVKRSHNDEEYKNAGFEVTTDVSHCDVLLGIKEVPVSELIAGKTYFYFSHTIKKQPYNQRLLQEMINKQIRMIDYETLVDDHNNRLIGFGLYAGIVGAHYGLLMYGKKIKQYELIPAKDCKDFAAMVAQYKNTNFPSFKTIVTGNGKVARGAIQVLDAAGFEKVSPADFLHKTYETPVYTNLTSQDLYIDGHGDFDKEDFYKNPQHYNSKFHIYAAVADVLINGIFWNERIPRLFEKEQINTAKFRIKAIADISCDIHGSVPLTFKSSTIGDPIFGVDRQRFEETKAFHETLDTIEMMTVDNLPNELPRDASAAFGNIMVDVIIPELLKEKSSILERATICENGKLASRFDYLSDYVGLAAIVQ